jgi:LPXTG-motif cell wall-anchored protein
MDDPDRYGQTAGADASLPATAGETPALALAGVVALVFGLSLLVAARRRTV